MFSLMRKVTLCPAILWQDCRASDEAAILDAKVTAQQKKYGGAHLCQLMLAMQLLGWHG